MTEDRPSVRRKVGGLWLHVPIWDGEMENPTGVRAAARTVAERVEAGKRCWSTAGPASTGPASSPPGP